MESFAAVINNYNYMCIKNYPDDAVCNYANDFDINLIIFGQIWTKGVGGVKDPEYFGCWTFDCWNLYQRTIQNFKIFR